MKHRFKDMAGIYTGFVLGALLLFMPLFNGVMKSRPLASNNPSVFTTAMAESEPQANETPVLSGKPLHITIQSVGIDLDVIQGLYNPTNQKWTLSETEAIYASNTVIPNNKEGSTFIYGHNQEGVFGTLPDVQIGDEAQIKTDNGLTFIYTFAGSKQTTPQDVEVLNYHGAPIVTLQTCTGLWMENRTMFVFVLKEVKS